jgi:exodeoxyribonuclease III
MRSVIHDHTPSRRLATLGLLLLAWAAIVGHGTAAGCDSDEVARVTESSEPQTLRVMSFNIWVGGEAGGQPLEQTAAVIRAARADIVGIQESFGRSQPRTDNAEKIAQLLGWNHVNLQGGSTSIITRFPIVEKTPQGWGAGIRINDNETVTMFNAHLAPSPYQPYQLADIPYGTGRFIKTEAETIDEAKKARGRQVTALLADIQAVVEQGRPMFLTGDMNEPSHQDWTQAAADLGQCQIKVEYPTTKAITDQNFVDAFRVIHSDETKRRGHTWTPTKAADDPSERHDRIDYVFFHGSRLKVTGVEIVGEATEGGADIVVTPYPSDHRAVVAEFELSDR